MSKFEIGDLAVIVKTCRAARHYLNMQCEIISDEFLTNSSIGEMLVHRIEPIDRLPEHSNKSIVAPAWCMRPIYDGNTKTSWDDCVWKPTPLVELDDWEQQRERQRQFMDQAIKREMDRQAGLRE